MKKIFKILGITALVGAIGYLAYNQFKKTGNNSSTPPDTKPTPTPTTPNQTTKPTKKVSESKAKESVVKTSGYNIVKLRDDYKKGGYKTYNESFATLGDWAMFSEYCKANPCGLIPEKLAILGQAYMIDEVYSIDLGTLKDGHDLGTKVYGILSKSNPSIASLPSGTYAIPMSAFFDTKSVEQIGGNLNPSQLSNTNPLIMGYLTKAANDYNSFIHGKGWDGSYDVITPNFYIPTNATEGQIAREARQSFDDAWRQQYGGGGGTTGRCYDPSTGQYGDCVGNHTQDMS